MARPVCGAGTPSSFGPGDRPLETPLALRPPLAKIRRMSILVRVGALAALAVLASACTPKDPQYAINYTEKRGVIEANGLRFVILPDPSTQLVEVDVRYGVGANEDPDGK